MSAVCNPDQKDKEEAALPASTTTSSSNVNSNSNQAEPPTKKAKKVKKKKSKKNKQKNTIPGYKRVQKELQQLLLNPPQGIGASPARQDDLLHWIASIEGPCNTPYKGGTFYLNIKFGENYPFEAPKVTFKTKIYHCNIRSNTGEICLDVLKDNYSPALTVEKILLSLCALLQCPNPDDPLVADIAQIYKVDQKAHDQTAREWTRRYAMASKQDDE